MGGEYGGGNEDSGVGEGVGLAEGWGRSREGGELSRASEERSLMSSLALTPPSPHPSLRGGPHPTPHPQRLVVNFSFTSEIICENFIISAVICYSFQELSHFSCPFARCGFIFSPSESCFCSRAGLKMVVSLRMLTNYICQRMLSPFSGDQGGLGTFDVRYSP